MMDSGFGLPEQPAFISFSCPTCSLSYPVSSDRAGKKTKCPGCGQQIMVPLLPQEERVTAIPPVPTSVSQVGVLCDGCLKMFQAAPGIKVRCPGCGRECLAPTEAEVEKEPKRLLTWEEQGAAAKAPSRSTSALGSPASGLKQHILGPILIASALVFAAFIAFASQNFFSGSESGVSSRAPAPTTYTPPPSPQVDLNNTLREQQEREAAWREQLIIAIARRRAKDEDDLLRSKYELEKHLHDSREMNRSAAADFDGRIYLPRPFRPYVSQEDALYEKNLREARRDYGNMDLKLLEEVAKGFGAI
jgi:ribosomal protein S27E